MNNKKLIYSCVAASLMIVTPGLLMAEDPKGIKVGKGNLSSSLKLSVYSDSNYNLADDTETKKSATNTKIQPKFKFKQDLSRFLKFKAGAGFENIKYNSTSYYTQDKNKYNLDFNVDYKSGDLKGTAKYEYQFKDSLDVAGATYAYRPTSKHSLLFSGGKKFSRQFKSSAALSYIMQDHSESIDDYKNYDSTLLVLSGAMLASPKTWTGLTLTHKMQTYGDDNTTSAHDFSETKLYGTVTWDGHSKLSGLVALGFGSKSHDKEIAGDGRAYDDQSTLTALTDVTYKVSKVTNVNFKFNRLFNELAFHTTKYNNTQTDTVIGLEHNFYKKYTFKGNLLYQVKDYDTADSKKTKGFKPHMELNYDINKWFDAGVFITYENLCSNITDGDYKRTKLGLTLTGKY
jgi:hypothetical protein